jgi:hypothetical protein
VFDTAAIQFGGGLEGAQQYRGCVHTVGA